jgi:hypothetical protein
VAPGESARGQHPFPRDRIDLLGLDRQLGQGGVEQVYVIGGSVGSGVTVAVWDAISAKARHDTWRDAESVSHVVVGPSEPGPHPLVQHQAV